MISIPSYLKKGDCIGMVCSSGFMPVEKAQNCIKALQLWGFEIRLGKTLGTQFHYFSGTDEERLHDLQTMIDDENIKAILCARGGYGLSRIIDGIDFSSFKKNPKWIIGYSDVTILQAHLFTQLNCASIHSPMAAAFNDGENIFLDSLRNVLIGKKINYSCKKNVLNKKGIATGKLVGGNLSIIAHLIGSSSSFNTENKILFIEDVGEYIYNIDRLMMQLKRAGMLKGLRALIVGSFTEMKDTTVPFGQNIYDLIFDKVKEYDYPVCFGFPVGHVKENLALKIGATYKLVVDEKISLIEINSV
jgi:muramoyltetrapeptide carboxypeptidase